MSLVPLLAPCLAVLPQGRALEGAPRLERVAVLEAGGKGPEIVAVQAASRRAVLTLSGSGAVERFDLADLAAPRSRGVIDLGLEDGEELTSVALPPAGDWFLVTVKAPGARAPGRALAVSLEDGARLASFPCGVGPDAVVLARDGSLALIANEAEGFARDDDGELRSAPGSLTLVRLAQDLPRSAVVQIPFPEGLAGSGAGRRLLRQVGGREREVALGDGPEFLEPEGIALHPDGTRALVTLQENDAVAWIDLAAARVERLLPLGKTTHPADLFDDGRFDERGVLTARREPDGIAFTPDGRFFVTADEGATEPGSGAEPELSGGRTLSVFDASTGALVGDTGPELDRLAALAELYPDRRSPRKGSEPEMVVTFEHGGTTWAAVTLERAGALALVDLREPSHPRAVSIAPTGTKSSRDEPEGLAHLRDQATGTDYFYVANEGTGTFGVLRVPR